MSPSYIKHAVIKIMTLSIVAITHQSFQLLQKVIPKMASLPTVFHASAPTVVFLGWMKLNPSELRPTNATFHLIYMEIIQMI